MGLEANDPLWMQQTLALAASVEASTSPNPRVGCLLVRDGRVVGAGAHRGPGQPHAEALAVAAAGDDARGSTAYVNLEPCAHQGLTPPCADLLIRRGIARVVASIVDPDPRVNGRGFERLREAGIVVDVGVEAQTAERLNEPFLHWHRVGRVWVTMKAAVSLDGRTSGEAGVSRWITNEYSRRFAHRLRMRSDAILVGAETARRDRPRLTVRLPSVSSSPTRIVVSRSLEIDPTCEFFHDGCGGVLVFGAEGAPSERVSRLSSVAEVRCVPAPQGRLDLGAVLAELGRRGVRSLLVEGGARTFAGFIEAGLADVGAIFLSGRLLGEIGGTPLLSGPAVPSPELGWSLRPRRIIPFEQDCLWLGDFVPRRAGSEVHDVYRTG